MSSLSGFATGARAAARHELQEAQRRYRLVMHRAVPKGRPIREGLALHICSAADLVEESQSLLAGVVELQIDSCADVGSLTQLSDMSSLETLRIGGLAFVANLDWLPPLPRLRALRIEGFGRGLTSLRGIAGASALEALVLDPLDEMATVESLAPLAALTELQLLVLPRIATTDSSLRALSALQKLTLFHSAAYYGPDEYEALANNVPALRCPWFSDLAWKLL